jgi:ADP-heptose:LPS heptosyltransferase
MRVLVMNLTRFGDLLQTQAVFSDFKAAGHETGLVCLENFQAAADLLADVDAVYALPGASILPELSTRWAEHAHTLMHWAAGIRQEFRPDLVVNLTATLPAQLLSRLLAPEGQSVRGFGMDEHGFAGNSGPWASFLLASVKNRGCSPFNMSDMFRKAAESDRGPASCRLKAPTAELKRQAGAFLKEGAPEGTRGFIGVQLGASVDRRRWPTASFARVCSILWEQFSLCPVLLGTKGEAHLGEKFRSAAECPSLDVMGRTDLTTLSAALTHMRLLLTNDTGTMHLAAGLGVPCCAFFLSTAQAWDTGPSLAGCLCLEPDMPCHPCEFTETCTKDHACRTAISADVAAQACAGYLKDGTWGEMTAEGVRAWESTRDEEGFMDLQSRYKGGESAERTRWIRMQRAAYRRFLDHEPFDGKGLGLAAPEGDLGAEIFSTLEESRKQLFLLKQQAKVMESGGPVPEAISKKFMSGWNRLRDTWMSKEHFTVLGGLWMEESQSMEGNPSSLREFLERYAALLNAWSNLFGKAGTGIEE